MQDQTAQPVQALAHRFSDYLPTLAAGVIVLAVGIVVGWLAKRAMVRLLVWLRLDRFAGRVGWRAAFGKGDVRAALYNSIGTTAMAIVVLLFLDEALKRWGLTALSRVIRGIVFYLPNVGLVALIVGVGGTVTNALSGRVREALEEEEFEHAGLLAKILKGALLAVVVALALWQLQFAREIVLAAFLIAFGSAGVAFALAVGLGSVKAIQRGWDALFDKRKTPQ